MLRSRLLSRSTTALLSALTALLLVGPLAPAEAASTFSGSLAQGVAAIPTSSEANTGYDRTLFKHWVDADGDGCRTRAHEVLITEAEPTPITVQHVGHARWRADAGTPTTTAPPGRSPPTSTSTTWCRSPRPGTPAPALDVAARRPTPTTSATTARWSAVTDNVNQSKGDQDPATWMPTYDQCRYVREWVAVKIRWGLSADPAEKSVLDSYASSCSNTITVTLA